MRNSMNVQNKGTEGNGISHKHLLLQRHTAAAALYLLARQHLNPPNAPASLTSVNLSQTHPPSDSSSKSGRALGVKTQQPWKTSQNFDVQRIILPHQ